MYSVNEKRLEKKRQLRENIEEYLANSFCTVQTELELLEKHIRQNPETPTYSIDSEMLQDISQRLRALEDAASSMLTSYTPVQGRCRLQRGSGCSVSA